MFKATAYVKKEDTGEIILFMIVIKIPYDDCNYDIGLHIIGTTSSPLKRLSSRYIRSLVTEYTDPLGRTVNPVTRKKYLSVLDFNEYQDPKDYIISGTAEISPLDLPILDITIDMTSLGACYCTGREELINYVWKKYGRA